MNWDLLYSQLGNLNRGAVMTLTVTAVSLALGVVLGLTLAIMQLSPKRWLNVPAKIYITIFRGTPMLVQIVWFYYGIFPTIGLAHLSAVYAGTAALGMNSGAYLGEIFRGGIQSIGRGQTEAALSLGLSDYQVMRYVILPQALANALPAMSNEFITLIKDSSLLQAIALLELTHRSMMVASRTLEHNTMYFGIAVYYLVMTYSTARVLNWLERKLRKGYK